MFNARGIFRRLGALAVCAVALCAGVGEARADSWYWFWTTANGANPGGTTEYCRQNAQRALAGLGNVQTIRITQIVDGYGASWNGGSADLICMPVERGMYVTLVIRSAQNDAFQIGKRFEQAFWGDAASTDVAGTWYRDGDRSKPVSISVNGNQLSLTNEFGTTSRGHFADAHTIVADDWEGGLRGSLNGNRIDWGNSTSWSR